MCVGSMYIYWLNWRQRQKHTVSEQSANVLHTLAQWVRLMPAVSATVLVYSRWLIVLIANWWLKTTCAECWWIVLFGVTIVIKLPSCGWSCSTGKKYSLLPITYASMRNSRTINLTLGCNCKKHTQHEWRAWPTAVIIWKVHPSLRCISIDLLQAICGIWHSNKCTPGYLSGGHTFCMAVTLAQNKIHYTTEQRIEVARWLGWCGQIICHFVY